MTIAVQNVETTNTFDFWRNRTNELADALSNKVLTVDSNTTTGNASVNGYIFANNFNTGNSTVNSTSNSSTYTVTAGGSTVTVNSTAIYVGNSTANALINSSGIYVTGATSFTNINVQSSGLSAQIVDYFAINTYRSADYVLNIGDNAANAYQSTKATVLHDGGTTYLDEFGIVYSNTDLGSLSANANATHTRVYFTPTVSNSQIKGYKTMVVV